MQAERIQELVKYYSASAAFLQQLIDSDENVNETYMQNAKVSRELFEDTVECLTELLNLR